MKVIAHIQNDFPSRVGIPHQSGRIRELKAKIVFEPGIQKARGISRIGRIHIYLADLGILTGCAGWLGLLRSGLQGLVEIYEKEFLPQDPLIGPIR